MPSALPRIRSDLVIRPDQELEGRYYVKDPVRRQYFRFNELQIAMMRALDGETNVEQIVDILGEEFGTEIPAEQIERFTERLERELLLDVACYPSDPAPRKQVARAARAWRESAEQGAELLAARERALLAAGLAEMEQGRAPQAAAHFDVVLASRPTSRTAATLRNAAHRSYFESHRERPPHMVMARICNPDRFLGWFDARFGRAIYHPLGVLAIAAIILSSVPAAIDVLERPTLFDSFSAGDVAVMAFFGWLGIFIHEFGHGLTCKHYGGVVDDIGLQLFYGVVPGAYCDISDTYVFARRRHKVAVALSGVTVQMLYQTFFWHLLAFTDPSLPVRDGILAMLLYSLWLNFQNLIPLVPLDGYYALSDYLGITNLRPRSFDYLRRLLAARILGVRTAEPEPSARERHIFLVFGVLAVVYTVLYVYGIWISFLLPLATTHLGSVGLVISILYLANLVGRVILGAFIRLLRFMGRERRVIFTWRRSVALAVSAGAVAALLCAPWPLALEGEMVVEPEERALVVARVPGVVAEIRVEDGDSVAAGQIIAVLRDPGLARDHAVALSELEIARAQLEMLRRGARPEEEALARAQLSRSRAEKNLMASRLAIEQVLVRVGAGRGADLARAQSQIDVAAARARAASFDAQLVASGPREEQIAAAEAELRRRQARVDELAVRRAQLEIKAPIAGTVIGTRLRERQGERLAEGDRLCEIHDGRRWRAVISLHRGQPLGDLRTGEHVALKANGDPNRRLDSEVEMVLAPRDGKGEPVVRTGPVAAPGWRAQMSGRAQIDGADHSVAYRIVAVPIIRIIDYDLWRLLWG